MSYAIHLVMVTAIYALLALSLRLSAGFLGLVSICQAAFFGIGAYAAAFFLKEMPSRAYIVLGVALVAGYCAATLLGLALFRLREDYFAIASFAFQAIATAGFYNLRSGTGGAPGLAGIGSLDFQLFRLSRPWHYAVFTTCVVVAVWLAQLALVHSPAGRILAAIREDEISVVTVGLNPTHYRTALFGAGGALAALAGALYASYMTFIDPTPFSVYESILILCCIVIGGFDSVGGPVLGAAVLVCLPEALRFLGLPSSVAATIRQIVFGIALVLVVIMRPSGPRRSGRP